MEKWLFVPLALIVAAIVVLANTVGNKTSTPTPTHVVAVYVDGLDHLDYRAVCSTIHAPIAFRNMAACEGYFAFNTAMTGVQAYRVVKHSVKVWTQQYRGHTLKLATVQYANLTTPYVLTCHLRLIHGQWKIWAATT